MGHTIKLPAETAKLKAVELWRQHPRKVSDSEYERRMTSYFQQYNEATGENVPSTVGVMWGWENWYDSLSAAEKNRIRKDIIVKKINPPHSTRKVHIDEIRPGDTVIHDGKIRTVTGKDIRKSQGIGKTLFGDSYRLGTTKVTLVEYPRYSKGKRMNSKSNPRRGTKGKTMAKRKNPRTALSKAVSIPKGKRAGEQFTKGGKRYVVVSYIHPSSGKRVRFARKIKATRRKSR